jgi:hypothetical protein
VNVDTEAVGHPDLLERSLTAALDELVAAGRERGAR